MLVGEFEIEYDDLLEADRVYVAETLVNEENAFRKVRKYLSEGDFSDKCLQAFDMQEKGRFHYGLTYVPFYHVAAKVDYTWKRLESKFLDFDTEVRGITYHHTMVRTKTLKCFESGDTDFFTNSKNVKGLKVRNIYGDIHRADKAELLGICSTYPWAFDGCCVSWNGLRARAAKNVITKSSATVNNMDLCYNIFLVPVWKFAFYVGKDHIEYEIYLNASNSEIMVDPPLPEKDASPTLKKYSKIAAGIKAAFIVLPILLAGINYLTFTKFTKFGLDYKAFACILCAYVGPAILLVLGIIFARRNGSSPLVLKHRAERIGNSTFFGLCKKLVIWGIILILLIIVDVILLRIGIRIYIS